MDKVDSITSLVEPAIGLTIATDRLPIKWENMLIFLNNFKQHKKALRNLIFDMVLKFLSLKS